MSLVEWHVEDAIALAAAVISAAVAVVQRMGVQPQVSEPDEVLFGDRPALVIS